MEEATAWLPAGPVEKLGFTARCLLPGMISLHEEHSVRIDAGYKIDEWGRLDPAVKAFEVAIRRINGMIEKNVVEESKP